MKIDSLTPAEVADVLDAWSETEERKLPYLSGADKEHAQNCVKNFAWLRDQIRNRIQEFVSLKQTEAVDTLFDLFRQSRKDESAQATFLTVALLLAQRNVLDYLVAALLKQAQELNIPPTKSLLLRDMAFEIEAAMRQQKVKRS